MLVVFEVVDLMMALEIEKVVVLLVIQQYEVVVT